MFHIIFLLTNKLDAVQSVYLNASVLKAAIGHFLTFMIKQMINDSVSVIIKSLNIFKSLNTSAETTSENLQEK